MMGERWLQAGASLAGILILALMINECERSTEAKMPDTVNILYLHHSTGKNVWMGAVSKWVYRVNRQGAVERYLAGANQRNGTNYHVQARVFPQKEPYGWHNYPYDYWNIWVNHAGVAPYQEEPTLEIISRHDFDVVSLKHCYPVCHIKEDPEKPAIDSPYRCIANYKLQYNALKKKMRQFPHIKFIVWTGAAMAHTPNAEAAARRAREFFQWVRDEWDEEGDNIFIWDFYELETQGGLFLKDEYCREPGNSHPSREFSETAARLFARRLIDVVEGRGNDTPKTGGQL